MKVVARSILLSPLLVAALAGPASGVSLTVSKTTDDGSPWTLRAALAQAGPGDVIATADASGAWAIPAAAAPGEYIAATETGGSGTSALSAAAVATRSSGGPSTPTIKSGPPRFGNRSSVVFRFTVPPGTTTVACAVDNGRFAPCRSPYSSGYLLDGRHIFHLRTTDAAGESAVLDSVFTIDTLPPAVSLGGVHVRVSSAAGRPVVTFTVACPPSEPGGCSGTLGVGTVPDPKTHHYRVVGRVGWKAPPNDTVRVVIAVPPWAIAPSRLGRGLLVRVALLARDDAGNVIQIRRSALILPPAGTAAAHRSARRGSSSQGSTSPRLIA